MKLYTSSTELAPSPKKFIKGIGSSNHALMQKVDGSVVNDADYFCDLLNHNTDHTLQTTAHPIEPLHLNASELNEAFPTKRLGKLYMPNGLIRHKAVLRFNQRRTAKVDLYFANQVSLKSRVIR